MRQSASTKRHSDNVASFERGAHIVRLRAELAEWRARLQLAFECDWSFAAWRIIESEIEWRRKEIAICAHTLF